MYRLAVYMFYAILFKRFALVCLSRHFAVFPESDNIGEFYCIYIETNVTYWYSLGTRVFRKTNDLSKMTT